MIRKSGDVIVEPFYSPRLCCPVRAALSHEIAHQGNSDNPDPACYFSRFSVVGHEATPTFDTLHPGRHFSHTTFRPPGCCRPMAPVQQCYSSQMACTHGSAVQPTFGQQKSPGELTVDTDSVTSATESCTAESLPEGSAPGNEDHKVKKRRARMKYHGWQKELLEAYFQMDNYLSETARSQLATTLGITECQVKVWFQNRRIKQRKQRQKILSQCDLPCTRDLTKLTRKPPQIQTGKIFRLIGGDGREIVNTIAGTPMEALQAMSRDSRAFDAPPSYYPMPESNSKSPVPETQVTSTLTGSRWQCSAEADKTTPPPSTDLKPQGE